LRTNPFLWESVRLAFGKVLGALRVRFLAPHPGRKRQGVGARALERYGQLLRKHVLPVLGARKLQQIDSANIDALYLSLEGKMSPRTAYAVHTVFSACLGAVVRTRKLVINPMQSITKAPSVGESDHGIALDGEELRRLVQGFKVSALFGIVSVAAFTGARRNEILALRWSDLDPVNKTLRIERALEETDEHGIRFKGPKKERHKRTITIDDDLLALLLAARDKYLRLIAGIPDGVSVDLGLVRLPDNALMFPNPPTLTEPRHPRNFTKEFARVSQNLGFKLRFHSGALMKPCCLMLAFPLMLSPLAAVMTRQRYSATMPSEPRRPTQARQASLATSQKVSSATDWVQLGSKSPDVRAVFPSVVC
jgi:integrase